MYTIIILPVFQYYRYILSVLGLPYLLRLTDSGYPRILSLGWCLHSHHEPVVCRMFNWELRLWHELGHSVGMKHVNERGHVMHPWGILRGYSGIEQIETLLQKEVSK